MKLGKFVKAPADVKRYEVQYADWLDTGETVSTKSFSVSPTTLPPFTVGSDSLSSANTGVTFYVSGGLVDTTYTVTITITTSGSQTKQDTIDFVLRTP